MSQQLEGNIRFGLSPAALTDFSDELSKLEILQALQTTTRPKTFANASEQQNKSGYTQSINVNYLIDEASASGFSMLVMDAQLNDSTASGRRPGELYFSATMKTGPADPDTNPEWTGWTLPVTAKLAGGTVGDEKQHDGSWPARSVAKTAAES